MKKNRLGITEGEASSIVIDTVDFKLCAVGVTNPNRVICHLGFGSDLVTEEDKANAALIADAFNTANKCGLLPSELLEQRDELLTCLKNTYGKLTAQTPEYIFDAIQDTINQIEQQTKTNE